MKVTFVLATLNLSGGERIVSIYAQALKRRGHEVFVIASGPTVPTIRQRIKGFLAGRVIRKQGRGPCHMANTDVNFEELAFRRPVVAGDLPDADVIVATWWETANWIDAAPVSKGRKVHFVQGYEAFEPSWAPQVEKALALPMPKIVVARWLDHFLREEIGAKDIAWVPNAIDTKLFYAPPRQKNKNPVVGMIYNHERTKGSSIGTAAFELLRKSIPNVSLVAFGAKNESAEIPFPEGTEYFQLPAQDALRGIYSKADVWLSPSWKEGFGLPAFEAMACRTPVVVTNTGGAADFIQPGQNGYVSEPGDWQGLARQMENILRLDDCAWRNMSDAALQTVQKYTLKDAIDLFEKALLLVSEGAAVSSVFPAFRLPEPL